MKKTILLLTVLFFCGTIYAQCPQGDIILTTQQEVDGFATTYPGCIEVLGSIKIIQTDITSLVGLSQITSIDGDLIIDSNSSLTDLAGLDNLTYVGYEEVYPEDVSWEYLSIINNDNLTDLSGLNNLTSVNGYFDIQDNNNLVNLTGLDNLASVVFLRIELNDNLTNLIGLDNLTHAGAFRIESNNNLTNLAGLDNITSIPSLRIQDNDNLIDLAVLSNLTSINYLTIENNNNLVNLTGLDNITSVSKILRIISNENLTDLTNLSNLTSVGWDLRIDANNGLTDLTGLNNITSIGRDLQISSNSNLTNLTGVNNITNIGGNLIIDSNNSLMSLSALYNLTSVGGGFSETLSIINNDNLISLAGLENITYIGGSLIIESNDNLTDLITGNLNTVQNLIIESNDNLTSLTGLNITLILDDLSITSNNSLTDLTGLENLNAVRGALLIDSNNSLTDLTGLDNITYVGDAYWESLNIINNDNLMDLTGLGSLTSVENLIIENNDKLTDLTALNSITFCRDLWIRYNDNLVDLTGLESIGPTTIELLNLRSNPNLSICGLPNICTYLADGGTSSIFNNAPNCNSSTEIVDLCSLLPIEMTNPLRVHIKNKIALLQWRTETETNNSGFEIQRSKDGINWEKIGWQGGQGTSTTTHTYAHRDTNPLSGTSYYRLKQVDFDGQFDYSNIVSLRYDKLENITVYPIPAKDVVIFDVPNIAAADEIILYDITGKQISRQAFPQDKQLAVSHLNDGVYIYRIFYEEEVYSGKIVVE